MSTSDEGIIRDRLHGKHVYNTQKNFLNLPSVYCEQETIYCRMTKKIWKETKKNF